MIIHSLRAALFIVGTTLTFGSAAIAGAPVNSASGGGSVPITDMPMESYGFHAAIDAYGQVKGKAVFQFRPQEARFFAEITCLQVVANEAWIGGELTKVDVEGFPPLPIYFLWKVQDNGQGKADPSDQISSVLLSLNPSFSGTCTELPDLGPLFELTNGNIQVD